MQIGDVFMGNETSIKNNNEELDIKLTKAEIFKIQTALLYWKSTKNNGYEPLYIKIANQTKIC
jgi:hypothetical protein